MTRNADVKAVLRQMIAVMTEERQALAGMDIDAIMGCSENKTALCDKLADASNDNTDEEFVSLLETARQLNEVNRQIRNLVAANVSARLDAMTGQATTYKPSAARAGYTKMRAG